VYISLRDLVNEQLTVFSCSAPTVSDQFAPLLSRFSRLTLLLRGPRSSHPDHIFRPETTLNMAVPGCAQAVYRSARGIFGIGCPQ
jgi:hypothetical protein